MLPTCARYGMGVITWSPLAGGWLTGRYRKGADIADLRRAPADPGRYDLSIPANQRKLDVVEELASWPTRHGLASLTHLAHRVRARATPP